MKLLFFITGMPLGGAERVMSTLANYCVRQGNEVRILTMKTPECAYRLENGVEIIGANASLDMSSPTKCFKSIVSIVRGIHYYKKQLIEYEPDLVLSFLTYTNLIASAVGRKKAPVIISERCDPRMRNGLLIHIVNHFYPKVNCIVCQSKTIEQYFKRIRSNLNTVVIPNPVNPECINSKHISTRSTTIIAAGRLSKQKNYPLLINAFNKIKDELPDYTIEIFGQGPEKDNIDQLIKEWSLENRISLMGTIPNVMKEKADSTMFVMSSDYEGFPNALVEAMSSGLPVISTDFYSGVAHELIQNGINGYVVPVGDVDQLASAIKSIALNTDLQNLMSSNNMIVGKQFIEDNVCKMWLDLFKKVVKQWQN